MGIRTIAKYSDSADLAGLVVSGNFSVWATKFL